MKHKSERKENSSVNFSVGSIKQLTNSPLDDILKGKTVMKFNDKEQILDSLSKIESLLKQILQVLKERKES